MMRKAGLVLFLVGAAAADGPCCKTCTEPLEKYFSVDDKHGYCGEACMDPKKFNIYKIFEKNLTKATDNTPCSEQFSPHGQHYTKYTETVTHGLPGLLSVTLDLYAPVNQTIRKGSDTPCCKACPEGKQKYFSVVSKQPLCGECCIDPSKEGIFHLLEKNLTKATDNTPCAEQFAPDGTHYTVYKETESHGIPGLLSVEIDFYSPGSK
jgi:hypothetical protein